MSEGGRLDLREANVFFLRCLDLKEILAAASHLLPVRCQQTMLVPTNISGRFQEELGGKNLRIQRWLSVWLLPILLEPR